MGLENGKGEKTLADWREAIDALDIELLALLSRRAAIACEIAAIKVAAGLPAYDARREQQVLERIAAKNTGPLDEQSVREIFRGIITETRRLGTQRMREQTEKSGAGVQESERRI
jgi:chorismate mutase